MLTLAEPMERSRIRAGCGTRTAGVRATVQVDIVGSYRTLDGKEVETEKREGTQIRLGKDRQALIELTRPTY